MKLKVYYRFITIISTYLSAFMTVSLAASQNPSYQSGIQTVLKKAILDYAQKRDPKTEFDVELLSVPLPYRLRNVIRLRWHPEKGRVERKNPVSVFISK